MGQKWTTAHTLTCRDTRGQRASVFHQIMTGDKADDLSERFVLGNGELLTRRDGVFIRSDGEEIILTRVTLR